jgi:hypothetical protein
MRHLKYNKECEYCKKQFIATRKDAKYCSNACASISYRFRKEGILNSEVKKEVLFGEPERYENYLKNRYWRPCGRCKKLYTKEELANVTLEDNSIIEMCENCRKGEGILK